MLRRLRSHPSQRLAEQVSAAAYGTILVLTALPLIDAERVSSGWGWELVTGVGLATWVAHLYAQVLGEHVRSGSVLDRHELAHAMAGGIPILLAAVAPAVVLGLGRVDALEPRLALWATVSVAFAQLFGLVIFVGSRAAVGRRGITRYAVSAAVVGVAVVLLKLILGH